MTRNYNKPLPIIDKISERFWQGCKKHELVIERCLNCGTYIYYPRLVCIKCISKNLEWVKVSGKGKLYSFSIVYRPPSEVFKEDVPYVVGLIELDEGVRLMSNIVNSKLEDIKIGMPVEVVFDDVTEEITLPKFRPID